MHDLLKVTHRPNETIRLDRPVHYRRPGRPALRRIPGSPPWGRKTRPRRSGARAVAAFGTHEGLNVYMLGRKHSGFDKKLTPCREHFELTASVEVAGPIGKWSRGERLSTCPQGFRRVASKRVVRPSELGSRTARHRPGSGPGIWVRGRRPGSVGILVHPDACLDVVWAVGHGGELQDPFAAAHGVVARDRAFCMQAEDVVDLVGPDRRHQGRSRDGGYAATSSSSTTSAG